MLKPRRSVKGLNQALRAAHLILERKLCFLTLMGEVGLGKSHIAQGIGWEWIEKDACHYIESGQLFDKLRATYDVTPVEVRSLEDSPFQRLFGYYCRVSLLLLDDLGVEKITEWTAEKLDILVNYRYERKIPLVVALNVLISDLPKRVADRLQDRKLGQIVVLSGPSYRTGGD